MIERTLRIVFLGVASFLLVFSPTWAQESGHSFLPERGISGGPYSVELPSQLSLYDLTKYALYLHPSRRVRQTRIRLAQIERELADAGLYPSLGLNAGWSWSGVSGVPSSSGGTIGLSLSQLVYDFGRTRATRMRASLRLAQAYLEKEQAEQEFLKAVLTDYITFRRSLLLRDVNESIVRYNETLEHQAKRLYEVGKVSRIDLVQAQSSLAQAQAELASSRSSLAVAETSLSKWLGREIVAEKILLEDWEPEERPLDQFLEGAYQNNLEQKVFALRIDESAWAIESANSSYHPSLSASGGYSWPILRSTGPSARGSWSVGVNLSWPLYNEPTLNAQVRSAKVNWEQMVAQWDISRLELYNRVRGLYLRLEGLRERLAAEETALDASGEALHLARRRYEVGVGNTVELTQKLESYHQQKRNLAILKFQELELLVQLEGERGGLHLDWIGRSFRERRTGVRL